MSFDTSAVIQGGSYGRRKFDKNDNPYFQEYGKAIYVDEIIDNIETQETFLKLSFRHRDGKTKRLTLPHQGIGDNSIVTELAKAGADAPKQNANLIIDTLRLQEDEIENSGQGVSKVYENLGWIQLPYEDNNGQIVGAKLCYRGANLLGHIKAKYSGDYKVTTQGSYQVWREMVINEILGRTTLEVLLIAGLSAVVNGIVAPLSTGENPIIHISYPSGKGKSTIGYLIASTAGEPFSGQRSIYQRNGTIKSQRSLYRSWGSTETAIIAGCAGNRGSVIVFNELSKLPKGVNVDNLLYHLSEGSDKDRGNVELKVQQSDYYATTFISLGETSLLEKCRGKEEGLRIRVMEIEKPLTDSAEHSRKITETCISNNGFAAPMLANYIINNGGSDTVMKIYKQYVNELPAKMPNTPSQKRFIQKFAALFLTTAEIASAALNISFNLPSILSWLQQYEQEKGQERNTSAESYNVIIEDCRININNFIRKGFEKPSKEIFGTVKYFPNKQTNGKVLLEEYAIRKTRLQAILDKHNFPNIKTCIAEWKAAGVLNCDGDRPTRSRKIDPNTDALEDVYVFWVFSAANSVPRSAPKSKLIANSNLKSLLADDNEEDIENE